MSRATKRASSSPPPRAAKPIVKKPRPPAYTASRALDAMADLSWFASLDAPTGIDALRREVIAEEAADLMQHVVSVLATNPGELSDSLRRRLRLIARDLVAVAAGGHEL